MTPETYSIAFDSLGAIADLAKTTGDEEARSPSNTSFAGCTFEQALHMARHGWPEGAEKAKRLLDRIALPAIENVYSRTFNDVTGSYVDVGAYVEGVPECMVNFHEDTRPARFAHIIVQAAMPHYIRVEQAMMRGVAIAAAVDALETRGIRCDIDLLRYSKGRNDDTSCISLPLKRAADPLNLDTLAFAIAHAGYLRRLMFAIMEAQSQAYRKAFGVPTTYSQALALPKVPGAILFQNCESGEYQTEQDAIDRVNLILAAYTKPEGV